MNALPPRRFLVLCHGFLKQLSPNRRVLIGSLFVLAVSVSVSVQAEDSFPDIAAIKAAVAKSIPLLEKAANGSMEQRKQCFTCHSQGLPIIALTTARARGFAIDADHLQGQLQFTAEFLARNKANYLEGKGQGGQVDTAGYALWALDSAGWRPDETTAAVTGYLLRYQNEKDHWKSNSDRPPSEQSRFTSSYLALRGLTRFGTPDQKDRIAARMEQVGKWLVQTVPEDTEDRVFRLRALQVVGASEDDRRRAFDDLIQTQREDGGWSQLTDVEMSDPYATGSALTALHQAGGLAVDDTRYRKGLSYLISSQLDDGSWHVVTRSKPFQTYFESGYPHGTDQFISTAAAGWATTALALALPLGPSPSK